MIKKLQKLKAKKGFTLVELIVVIAIIGVLTAILIPTMIGYVKSANITSADQTAASIRKTVSNVIAQMETKGCTLKNDGYFSISVTNSTGSEPEFTVTASASSGGIEEAGDAMTVSSSWEMSQMEAAIKDALENDLKEIKPGFALATIRNGVCVQAAYSAEDIFDSYTTVGIASSDFAEEGDGMISGNIVGTNPKVSKDVAGAAEEE